MNEDAKLTAALGGEKIGVKFLDGTEADILVRQLPMRVLLNEWAELLADEPKLVELYCGKEEGFDDKLTPDSHTMILETGERLNDPIFAAWAKRRAASNERQKAHLATLKTEELGSQTSSSTAAPA